MPGDRASRSHRSDVEADFWNPTAVLASLADTLMPEAFEHGRPLNAFATAAGFFLSFVLAA
jgi:hypothetical protein